MPQWSPLSTSGATMKHAPMFGWCGRRNGARSRRAGRQAHVVVDDRGLRAAMEPALDERGDPPPDRPPNRSSPAAMEPALDERGDMHRILDKALSDAPQWSPLSTSGATWKVCC